MQPTFVKFDTEYLIRPINILYTYEPDIDIFSTHINHIFTAIFMIFGAQDFLLSVNI